MSSTFKSTISELLVPSLRGGAPAWILHVVHSPDAAVIDRQIPIKDPTVIGRSAEGCFSVDDALMSRQHVQVEVRHGEVRLRDLGSRNGTFVDGKRTDETVLKLGAVLRTGGSFFILDVAGPSGEDGGDGLLGGSSETRRLGQEIARLAPAELGILLRGETGTGKEVAAALLHARSGRSGALIAVNCGAIPAELFESTLFGHVRGAFTGATNHAIGLFQKAATGTILLDEVGDMPLVHQPKLLRVLENREIYPVGANEPIALTARVISATHVALKPAIDAGSFRQDLFSRLAGFELKIAPLRRRRPDILTLAKHFWKAGGAPVTEWTADLVEALLLHSWPMNVRELRNTMDRLATLGKPTLRATDLAWVEAIEPNHDTPATAQVPRRARPSKDELEQALRTHVGNMTKVAAHFARDPKQIYRWLDHYGIDATSFRPQ